jgi:peptidoglycan-associated lipoprotein
MNKVLIAMAVLLFAVGCASRKPAPISGPPSVPVEEKTVGGPGTGAEAQGGAGGQQGAEGAGGAGGAGTDGAGGAGAGGAGSLPGKEASALLSQRSIFYDYDSFAVKEEYKPVIEAHAKFLLDHPTAKVFLQGNTDERGSREYNLALGQRRADSVRKMMQVLGVKDNQIETVSFGEEKPRSQNRDESGYTQNRRTDLVYQGE